MTDKHENPTDLPIDELMEAANDVRLRGRGRVDIHFKYTCEKCGARNTLAEPNTLYQFGECEDCGHHTRITRGGYLIVCKTGGTAPNLARILGIDTVGNG